MKRTALLFFALLILFSGSVFAGGEERAALMQELKSFVNERVQDAKNAEDPAEKREILSATLTDLIETIDKVGENPMVPDEDVEALAGLRESLQDRYDELNGLNGYEQIPDGSLNDYAQFLQQDIEQADKYVTISITTLLLIIIIILLI